MFYYGGASSHSTGRSVQNGAQTCSIQRSPGTRFQAGHVGTQISPARRDPWAGSLR